MAQGWGARAYMKDYAERFYKSRKWQKVRQYVWTRDKGLCQNCLKNGLIKGGDTVHHIIEINPENITNEEISLNPDNLVTLCRDCHAAMHRKQKRWTVDELGRVVARE
jgi:5-methylcytosine-specific restriction endonuclease McrA